MEIGARDLRQVCGEICNEVRPSIDRLRSHIWVGSAKEQSWEFVKRAAIVRQFEAANAILSMVDFGHGYLGVTLLRPAYEELLWLEYLAMEKVPANTVIKWMTLKEIGDSFKAQRAFLRPEGMTSVGFSKRLSIRIKHSVKQNKGRLNELRAKLGWDIKAQLPPVAFIAGQVGRKKEYDYLYQSTSRFVHFSPLELQRRVWGQHGSVTVTSEYFSHYWTDFALSWSCRILIETMIAMGFGRHAENYDGDQDLLSKLLRELRPVQILTASELESWDDPKYHHAKVT